MKNIFLDLLIIIVFFVLAIVFSLFPAGILSILLPFYSFWEYLSACSLIAIIYLFFYFDLHKYL